MDFDDLDKFINAVVSNDQKPTAFNSSTKENSKSLKGPHHNGPFITGDFLSETASNNNKINNL